MSLRQIRKLKELKHAAGGTESDDAEELQISERRKTNVFSQLAMDDSESSEEEEAAHETPSSSPEAVPSLGDKVEAGKPKSVLKVAKKKKTEKSIEKQKIGMVLDPSLKIDLRALNPSSELRRIFGASAPSVPFRGIKRRHWLIEPEGGWPLVVKDTLRMEVCPDGSFRLFPEPDYESKLKILSRIVLSHDVEALYQFVHLNPFHAHGLIQLASTLIEKAEFEKAYQLVRRSLYALQSSFLPGFHPDKSLILSNDSLFSSLLLRSMLLYSHLLSGQGCSRTSFEVIKLVFAMEGGMLSGCPRTHALLHLDAAAYKADQFNWISNFVSSNRLMDVFPGSAFLFAIAQKKNNIDLSDTHFSIKEIRKSPDESTPASVALIRALLMFPAGFRIIFGRDPPSGLSRLSDPFTNRLALAFSTKCGARIKIDDVLMNWIDRVVDTQLPNVIKLGLTQLEPSRPQWLLDGYSALSSAEFEWGNNSSGSFVEPRHILEMESQLLEIYSDEGGPSLSRNSAMAPQLSYPVSLESNPIAAFLQTLLPWSNVDMTGTEAIPVTGNSLLRQIQSSLGIARASSDVPIIQAAPDHAEEASDSGGSDEEEVIMDLD